MKIQVGHIKSSVKYRIDFHPSIRVLPEGISKQQMCDFSHLFKDSFFRLPETGVVIVAYYTTPMDGDRTSGTEARGSQPRVGVCYIPGPNKFNMEGSVYPCYIAQQEFNVEGEVDIEESTSHINYFTDVGHGFLDKY